MIEFPPLSFLKTNKQTNKQTVVIFGLPVYSGIHSVQNCKVAVKGDQRDWTGGQSGIGAWF